MGRVACLDRLRLALSLALLSGCQATPGPSGRLATPGPSARTATPVTEAPSPPRATYRVHDLPPTFWRYWAEAAPLPEAEQVRRLDSRSPEDDERYFLGGAEGRSPPSRAGYTLGYLVVKEVAGNRDLRALARLGGPALREEIDRALSRLAASGPSPSPSPSRSR